METHAAGGEPNDLPINPKSSNERICIKRLKTIAVHQSDILGRFNGDGTAMGRHLSLPNGMGTKSQKEAF